MRDLELMWNSVKSTNRLLDPSLLSRLPEGVRRYLQHAISNGAPLASAVRLRMHGEIKLKTWSSFSAEEVIYWDHGMVWRATARIRGIRIFGGDSFVDGRGAMRWKLFGIIPVVNASDPDITRSAAGRANIESIWLPSVLAHSQIGWEQRAPLHAHARFIAHGETAEIDYVTDQQGRLKSVNMPRWGNPGGSQWGYYNCGGFVEKEGTFGPYTIPIRMRVGWYFGTERFESEGEFFRVTIENATYR